MKLTADVAQLSHAVLSQQIREQYRETVFVAVWLALTWAGMVAAAVYLHALASRGLTLLTLIGCVAGFAVTLRVLRRELHRARRLRPAGLEET